MSTTILSLIQKAASLIGDPEAQAITEEAWVPLVDMAQRDLSSRLNLIKRIATFTIGANLDVYTYPDDCVQVTRLQYSATPATIGTWRDINEMSESQYRACTDYTQRTGDPTRYWPDATHFFLDSLPPAKIVSGGKLWYWGVSDPVLSTNNTTLEVRDSMQNLVVTGAIAYALNKLMRYDESASALRAWYETIDSTRSKLEDPSDDRRENVVGHLSSYMRGAR